MNHIRYVGYDATHNGHFLFDIPGGHDCWLLILTQTPALFRVNGELKEYPAKSAVLFPPNKDIYYRASGDVYANDWIRFDSDEKYVSAIPIQGVPFAMPDPEYCHNLFKLLTWEHTTPCPRSEQITDQLLRVLFAKLFEAASSASSAVPHFHELVRLRRDIYNNPQNSWTVAAMASRLHISAGYLQVIYKRAFGVSCIDDVIDGRIRLAIDRLLYSDVSVAQAAAASGYNNVEHFCRQFRKITGSSPASYRRSVENGEIPVNTEPELPLPPDFV